MVFQYLNHFEIKKFKKFKNLKFNRYFAFTLTIKWPSLQTIQLHPARISLIFTLRIFKPMVENISNNTIFSILKNKTKNCNLKLKTMMILLTSPILQCFFTELNLSNSIFGNFYGFFICIPLLKSRNTVFFIELQI